MNPSAGTDGKEVGSKKQTVPQLKTDEQVEAFLAHDLAGLDFLQFKTVRFDFERGLPKV